jgi:hypothetical protein
LRFTTAADATFTRNSTRGTAKVDGRTARGDQPWKAWKRKRVDRPMTFWKIWKIIWKM